MNAQRKPPSSRPALQAERPQIMTLDEVADYLRVHRSTVYRMAREGSIPSTKVANQWRFLKHRIDGWLLERESDTSLAGGDAERAESRG